MNKVLKVVLVVLAGIILVSGSLAGGWFLAEKQVQVALTSNASPATGTNGETGYSQVPLPGFNHRMMGYTAGRAFGGMMGNAGGRNFGGMMGYGGTGGFGQNYNSINTAPLTVDQASQAAQKYLDTMKISDLEIAEVIIFNNGAYVRVVEKSTGIGAFELLVDPVTLNVYPELGPNMMWNLKYGWLNHVKMMGAAFIPSTLPDVSAAMSVSLDQALQNAAEFLSANLPGTVTSPAPDAFYGYYTIEVMKDGKLFGMLSVNGFTGQVFYHTWHGTFIEMSEGE